MFAKILFCLPLLSRTLSIPLEARQGGNPYTTSNEAMLFAPLNGTSVPAGGVFNFTYTADDEDTTNIDVLLLRYIRIGQDFNATGPNNNRSVNVQVNLPANVTSGRYYFATDELDRPEDQDPNDLPPNPNDWSTYDLLNTRINTVKAPYSIVVTNSTDTTSSGGASTNNVSTLAGQDPDDALLLSPANNTVITAGSAFTFTYICDDNCAAVRVALVSINRVLNNATVQNGRSDNPYISTAITVPQNLTAGQYLLAVNERDSTDRPDRDDDDDDDDIWYNQNFDFDRRFEGPRSVIARPTYLTVTNGTANTTTTTA